MAADHVVRMGPGGAQDASAGAGADAAVPESPPTAQSEVSSRTGRDGKPCFPCPYCGHEFSKRFNLNMHIRQHTGERPFACPHCDKRYTLHANLVTHLRQHTGERPFACSHCDKRYTAASSLSEHVKIHFGHLPLSCSVCEKRFSHKSQLVAHMDLHSFDRPFACGFCTQRYASRRALSVHFSVHERATISRATAAMTASQTTFSSASSGGSCGDGDGETEPSANEMMGSDERSWAPGGAADVTGTVPNAESVATAWRPRKHYAWTVRSNGGFAGLTAAPGPAPAPWPAPGCFAPGTREVQVVFVSLTSSNGSALARGPSAAAPHARA